MGWTVETLHPTPPSSSFSSTTTSPHDSPWHIVSGRICLGGAVETLHNPRNPRWNLAARVYSFLLGYEYKVPTVAMAYVYD